MVVSRATDGIHEEVRNFYENALAGDSLMWALCRFVKQNCNTDSKPMRAIARQIVLVLIGFLLTAIGRRPRHPHGDPQAWPAINVHFDVRLKPGYNSRGWKPAICMTSG